MSRSDASPPAGPEERGGSGGPKSWRARGKSSAAGGRYRWQKDWVKSKDRERAGRLWRHRMKIAAAAGVFVALLVVFLVYVFWQQPRTPLVAFAVTNYPSPVPPNAWASEDVRALRIIDGETIDVFDVSDRWRKAAEPGVTAWHDQLRRLSNWRRTPIILYISMHGLINTANEPCLLPPGPFSADESNWLPISDLLAAIKKNLAADTQKLLILDCSRLDANWQLGLISNSFAEELVGAVRNADVPKLAVLCSAGPGQVGWDSPELGQSVFGHFMLRALRGEADAALSGNGDGKISLRELYGYLTLSVQHWVTQNRAAAHRPMLLTRGGPVNTVDEAPDFLLLWTSRAAMPQSEGFRSNVAESGVADLWRQHERLYANGVHRHAPLHWAHFEHLLLRLEQLDRAGSAYQEEAADTRDKLLELADQLSRDARTDSRLAAHSLPLAETWRAGERYFEVARRAWDEFVGDPREETARRLLAEIGPVDRTLQPGVVEIFFMRMLSEHLDGQTWVQTDALRRAADLHGLAQRVAAPEDERAFYVGQALVDAADAERRVAEDLLFVGGDALSSAEQRWDRAETGYGQAKERIDELARALALRDRALGVLPHYAWWQTRRLPSGHGDLGREFDREVNATLLPLVRETHALGSRLHRGDEIDASRRAELKQLVDAVQRRLDRLETRFGQDVQLVDAAADDQAALRRIGTLLEVPLVSGDRRNKLRTRHRELRRLLQQATQPPGETRAALPQDYRARMASWDRHPAAALADVAQVEGPTRTWDLRSLETSSQAGFLVTQGAQLRARLFDEIPAEIDRSLKETTAQLKRRDTPPIESREGRSRADHLARATWALRPLEPPAIAELHPVRALRSLDRHNLLVWHGRRTLRDFWGPAEMGQGPDQSFFHLAAQRNLQSARGLAQAVSDENLVSLLQERLAVAKQIAPPAADDVLLIDEEEPFVPESIKVRHPEELASEAGATANVSLRRAGAGGSSLPMHIGDAQRRRVGLPTAATEPEPLRVLIDRGQLGTETTDFEAVWHFRGHIAVDSFRWHPEPDFRLTAAAAKYTAPSIRVDGAPDGASVVFILDCSASMGRSTPGQGVSRMSVARQALRDILSQLAEARRYHVAVWFYGHRLRWGSVAGQAIPQDDYPRPIPGNVRPPNDVERILAMGHFGLAELTRIDQELQWARRFGETPLYLAMIQALQTEFANQPPERTKSVVVITDGVNKQNQESRPNTKEQVLEAWHEMPVPIHVVEFFLREDEFDDPVEDRRALSDLREIAATTGGDDLRVDDPEKLIEELERSLRLRYEVVDSSQKVVEVEQIGRDVDVPENRPYVVRLAADPTVSNECRPERGQALELQLDGAARALKFRRFGEATGDPRKIESQSVAYGRRNYLVTFHAPTWQRGEPGAPPDLRFPISIQDDDGRFTPRPKLVWTQITPVDPRQVTDQRAYPFYGLAFENDQPVPLWHCDVPNWPRRVRQAELSVWCAFDPVEPDAVVSVGEAQGRSRPLELDGSTFEVQLKSNPPRVIVVERHDPPELLDRHRVRVMLAPPNGPAVAATTRRRYYIGSGAVAHLFVFEDMATEALKTYSVQLTSHATLRKASVEVQNVRIPVPAGGALIRPD